MSVSLIRGDVDIRAGQATEYLLFAWMRVGFKSCLKVQNIRSGIKESHVVQSTKELDLMQHSFKK